MLGFEVSAVEGSSWTALFSVVHCMPSYACSDASLSSPCPFCWLRPPVPSHGPEALSLQAIVMPEHILNHIRVRVRIFGVMLR